MKAGAMGDLFAEDAAPKTPIVTRREAITE